MHNSYAQNGEDKFLWRVFEGTKDGVFVDIGSHDGKVLSNTLSFEEEGWSGICAEAHPTYAKACMMNRPRSIVVNAAISHEDRAEVNFYTTNMGHLSSIDPNMAEYFRAAYKKHFTGYKVVKVPMRTVNTLLKSANFSHVDFISIDVEGTETDVLRGFDLDTYTPRVVLTEAMRQSDQRNVSEYLNARGYYFALKLGNNLFFCRELSDCHLLTK